MELVRFIKIEEEFKKNPELSKSDLNMLRDWLKKQPHLPPITDNELILFLHSNYYRTEPTKITIDTFFTVRTHVPEFFSIRDPLGSKQLREIMKVVCCLSLPSTTPEGYKVIFAKLLDSEPSRYIFSEGIKLLFMVMELCLYNVGNIPGYIIVIDMDGTVFGHLARLNPMMMKKFLYYLEEAIPIRLQSIHYMNTVSFMDKFLNIIKPLIKNDLMNKLFLHSNMNTLSQQIPIELLPNEQGGKAGPLLDLWEAQIKELEEHRNWFLEQDARKVNEYIRPEKAQNATNIFGVEGSFKKLNID